MTDSLFSLIFPLHGINKLIQNDSLSQCVQSAECLNHSNSQPLKKSLILFGEDNM